MDPWAFWVESIGLEGMRTNQAKMSLAGDQEVKLRSTHYGYSLLMMPSLH